MPHVEDKAFDLHFELRCTFPDDYDGDEDGYAWTAAFPALAADLVRAIVQTVARHDGWHLRPANRGRSSEDEVMFVVERRVPGGGVPG